MIEHASRSYVGTDKSVNQDACVALAASANFGDVVLLAACDGVGGLVSGEQAGRAIAHAFTEWFDRDFPAYAADDLYEGQVDLEGVALAWASLLDDVNARMWGYSQRLNVRMGATCTALLLCSGAYVCCQVGDCRAYRAGDAGTARLTRDQTLVQAEVDAGRILPKDALRHPDSSAVTQAVGAQESLTPVFTFGHYADGDVFLACTDGLYRRLGDGRVGLGLAAARRAAGEGGLLGALDSMIARAVDAGEADNITGVIACMTGDETC